MLSVFEIIIPVFLEQHIRETRHFCTILLKHKYIHVSRTILDNDFFVYLELIGSKASKTVLFASDLGLLTTSVKFKATIGSYKKGALPDLS